MILKEEDDILKELLRERAKSHLTIGIKEKLCGEQWTECFDVATYLIASETERLDGAGRDGEVGGAEDEAPPPSSVNVNASETEILDGKGRDGGEVGGADDGGACGV